MIATTPLRRSPRLSRTLTAVIAAGVAVTAYQATVRSDHDSQTTRPANSQEDVPAGAAPNSAALEPDPFQAMSDLTPTVSAHLGTVGTTPDPYQSMSDLTPVVSAHINASITSADPFETMRDLTPVLAGPTYSQ